jgi:hypothetical protein
MDKSMPRYWDLPEASGGGRTAWGLYGSDDSVGRINLLTSQRVLDAVRLVRKGTIFALNAAVDEFDPPLDSTYLEVGSDLGVEDMDDALDDYFPQISSQWDSLAHIAATPGVFYNNVSLDDVKTRGANTIDHLAKRGIVGRGVLLDVGRAAAPRSGGGVDTSHGSISLSVADLEEARERADVSYSDGCIVLLRTGFIDWYRKQGLPHVRSCTAIYTHRESSTPRRWRVTCGTVVSRPSRRTPSPWRCGHQICRSPRAPSVFCIES